MLTSQRAEPVRFDCDKLRRICRGHLETRPFTAVRFLGRDAGSTMTASPSVTIHAGAPGNPPWMRSTRSAVTPALPLRRDHGEHSALRIDTLNDPKAARDFHRAVESTTSGLYVHQRPTSSHR